MVVLVLVMMVVVVVLDGCSCGGGIGDGNISDDFGGGCSGVGDAGGYMESKLAIVGRDEVSTA